MADAALFIGWRTPVRGREAKGLDVFEEALAFQSRLQEAGDIESYEVAILGPHEGGLNGFILIRGSEQQMVALRANDEFQRINARASMVVDDLGVVDAAIDGGIADGLATYRQAISDLA